MITTKDLYDIIENKISNEAQKSLIRINFPPHIADRMCNTIDCQEKAEHSDARTSSFGIYGQCLQR